MTAAARGRPLDWRSGMRRGAVLGPPLAFVVAFFLLPLLYLLVVSFLEPSQTELYEKSWTIENYGRVVADEFYLMIIGRSLLATSIVLLISLALAYPAALVIAGFAPRWRFRVLAILLFPLMVSNVVRAYGWISILGRRGVANTIMLDLGVIEAPLSLLYSFNAVVLGLLTILLPYMIISITNALVAIDKSYTEAAQSLGAGPWRTFWHVTLPLSSPGVASGCLIVFFLSLSAYVTISLLGGPRNKMLVSMIYDTVVTFQWPRAAALAFVLLFLALSGGAVILALARPGRIRAKRA
ncbi:MAG: ABC transporter permease [Alphaproteobacteria bacterium]|nr:ABC transporter permease [Alphaproteobacteria bacterium]